jgi:gamma-glutamylcysteine synthetase
MSEDEIDRQQFGEMVANVKTLLLNQASIKSDLTSHQNDIRVQLHDSNKRMFDKLDSVVDSVGQIEVAIAAMKPICDQHTEDIKHLKERPGRIVELGAAIIASVAAAIAWFK